MGKTLLKKENIPLIIFYIAYAIELAIVLIDKSAYINPIEGSLFRLTFLLCCLKVALTKYTNKEWLLIIVFLVLGAISYFTTDREEIIRFVMFVAASKGIDLKRTLRVTFYVTIIGVLLLMFLSSIGVLGWNYIESDFDGDGPEGIMRRYCFGLGHPNALHCMVFCIVLLGIYLYYEKISYVSYGLLFIINLILYSFTDSKTGMIIWSMMLGVAVLLKSRKGLRENNSTYVGGIISIVLMVLISVVDAVYGWNMPIFKFVDRYLTGRFGAAAYLGGTKYWSIFSSAENVEFFDMGYTRLFYWYGIIPALIYIAIVIWFINYCREKKDYLGYFVIIIISLYTFVEAHFISTYIARNYIIILLFGCWNEVFHVAGGKERYFYQLIGRKNKQTEF